MSKTFSITLMVFAAVLSTTFAVEQSAKGTLVIGPSQHLAESTICLNGQSTCHGLRKLEKEEEEEMMRGLEQSSGSGALTSVNETSEGHEFVCFGMCCSRCYGYIRRRLEDVLDEHRRLEVTDDSELKAIECFTQQSTLICN